MSSAVAQYIVPNRLSNPKRSILWPFISIVTTARLRTHRHNAGRIWKRTFRPKNGLNVFHRSTPEEFKNGTITGLFCFLFLLEETSSWEIKWLSWRYRVRKTPFSKRFPSMYTRTNSRRFQIPIEELFRKTPFWWRISVDGRPSRRNKAAFSNSKFCPTNQLPHDFRFYLLRCNALFPNCIQPHLHAIIRLWMSGQT